MDASPPAIAQTVTDFSFASTTYGGNSISPVVETPDAPAEFSAFKVANCSLTTIKMDCVNWVRKESKESATDGFVNWSAGDSVIFWWFDGRYYFDNAADPLVPAWKATPAEGDAETDITKKMSKATATIEYDEGIFSLVSSAFAMGVVAVFYTF